MKDLNCQIILLPSSFRCPTQAKGNITPAPVSPTWCAPSTTTASIDVPTTSKTWIFKRRPIEMKKRVKETAFQSEEEAVDQKHIFHLHWQYSSFVYSMHYSWDYINPHIKKRKRNVRPVQPVNKSHSRHQTLFTVVKTKKPFVINWNMFCFHTHFYVNLSREIYDCQ